MTCALCSADAPLTDTPVTGGPDGASAALCGTCTDQITGQSPLDPDHWRCLAAAMWSEDPATQVLAARMLTRLSEHDWARDLSAQLWLDDETRTWVENIARDTGHRDSNGVPLMQGDTVVLIKDLPVKGASFTAKRGTAVRGISLVPDNPAHIEGRVEGQRIVILTEFVKKRI
ncbi:MAG: alkylphosphonate utilization protein [Roseovarius sp.]|uniref:alkylphosphonate utilization protein n=1 Tax=Roseovarius sp. TaxID=1486281 RepID=UPI0032EE8ABB